MTWKDFWLALTIACLAWYTFVTLYVAWRGFGDIRQMLRKLRSQSDVPRSPLP